MSDSRSEREELALLIDPLPFDTDQWEPHLWVESIRMDRVTRALQQADKILAAGFTIQLPQARSVSMSIPPDGIHAAFDLWCDLGVVSLDRLEYTDDGVLDLESNVNFTPTDEHMPEELRAYPGDEL